MKGVRRPPRASRRQNLSGDAQVLGGPLAFGQSDLDGPCGELREECRISQVLWLGVRDGAAPPPIDPSGFRPDSSHRHEPNRHLEAHAATFPAGA